MNRERIRLLPKRIYEDLGGLSSGKTEREMLVLGWMHSGVATTDKVQETPRGPVEIPRGWVWGSYKTIARDLLTSVGLDVTTEQLRYTIARSRWSKVREYVMDQRPVMNGHYGSLYKLPEFFADRSTDCINLARLYQMFKHGDPFDFYMAERVAGKLGEGAKRGNYSNGNTWMTWVAENGFSRPAFVSVGRWRPGEEGRRDVPVYVPWITFDIDAAGDILDAKETAEQIVERLDASGYDPSRVFVSFSGSKGFHVQVSTSQIGNPIFADTEAASRFMRVFLEDIADGQDFDQAVASPLSLIRLTGSQHGKTGAYKRTWTADEFMASTTDHLLKDLQEHRPFEWVDPRQKEAEEEALMHAKQVAEEARNLDEDKKTGSKTTGRGPVINAIINGISEGETFGDKYFHVGRENAAFIICCWLLDRGGPESAWHKLKRWNNQNEPPLPRKRLKTQYDGAKRKLGIRSR